MPTLRKTTTYFRLPFLFIFGFLIIVFLISWFLFFKSTKPREAVQTKEIDSLFVYEDANHQEPSFSLKLPNGWYRDLGVKNEKRLLSFSPDRDNTGINYRASITASVVPTKLDLAGEVAKARKDIRAFTADHEFLADKSITIKGYPAHLFEYNTVLKNDNQNIKQILGEAGLLTHHVDIITVKNGYFIDIAAYTNEWAWPEFVGTIEKSLNTLSFTPDLTTNSQK